jgi:hypothetical protein
MNRSRTIMSMTELCFSTKHLQALNFRNDVQENVGAREHVNEVNAASVPVAGKNHTSASSKSKKANKEALPVRVETPAVSKGASPVRAETPAVSKDSSPPKDTSTSYAATGNTQKKGATVTQGSRNESHVAAARTGGKMGTADAVEEWNVAGSKPAKSQSEKKQPVAVAATMPAGTREIEATAHNQGNVLTDKDRANTIAAMESVRLQRARIHEQLQQSQVFAPGRKTTASIAAAASSASAASSVSGDTTTPARSGVRLSSQTYHLPPALQRDPKNPWNVAKSASSPESSVDPNREYSLDDHSHALLQNVVEMCVGSSSYRPTFGDSGMDAGSKPTYKPPVLQQHNSQEWTWTSTANHASHQRQDFTFECIMCMNEESEIVVVPCGHLMWCQKCANSNMEYLLCAQR